MSVFRRQPDDEFLSVRFQLEGKQIRRNAGTNNQREAEQFEKKLRRELMRAPRPSPHYKNPQREINDAIEIPLFRDFARVPARNDVGGRVWSDPTGLTAKYAKQPVSYTNHCARARMLVQFEPLANARLDEIDKHLIEQYTEHRSTVHANCAVTINKDLTALKAILERAETWRLIRSMPSMPWQKRNPNTERVGHEITPEEEAIYLAAADEDLADYFRLMLYSSAEPGATAKLAWTDVHFEPTGAFVAGWVFNRCTKNRRRMRELPMSQEMRGVLTKRWLQQGCPKTGWVFPADRNGRSHHTPRESFATAHKRLWYKSATKGPLQIPKFRLYDTRHTFASRLAATGKVDAFQLMDVMGWSSLAMAEVYIKSNRAGKARAIAALDAIRQS